MKQNPWKDYHLWMVLAFIAIIALIEDLNSDLWETIMIAGTFLFIIFLGVFHFLDRKGKM